MKIFKRQITSWETDFVFVLFIGIIALVIAFIPPNGRRSATFAFLSFANFFNAWRIHRKIKVAKTLKPKKPFLNDPCPDEHQ